MIAAIIIGIFVLSVCYAHFCGKVKQKFSRQLFDHSTFMAPINMFMTGFSSLPNKQAYFSLDDFPALQEITDNWQEIRAEALALQDHIKAATSHNDAGFNTFFRRGWKRFYLKWYGESHPSAVELCPLTTKLVSKVPMIKAAMFAELPSGSHLGDHRTLTPVLSAITLDYRRQMMTVAILKLMDSAIVGVMVKRYFLMKLMYTMHTITRNKRGLFYFVILNGP